MVERPLIATLAAAALVLVCQGTAGAASQNVTGHAESPSAISHYEVARTISVAGSNIYFRKTSGQKILLGWYKCGDRNVGGGNVWFDENPSPRRAIGTNFKAGTKFCLWAGGSPSETRPRAWGGTLWWNVSS